MSAVRLLLLLAAAAACAKGIQIADRDYRQAQLRGAGGARGRIVSAGDAVMYMTRWNETLYVLREGVATAVEGLPDAYVYDLLLDSSDAVWLATYSGLYQYSISKKKATQFSDRWIVRLGTTANGTVHALDFNSAALYMITGKSLHLVSKKPCWNFAFTREGHFYYVGLTNSTLYRAIGGPTGPSTLIAGYTGGTSMLEVDRRDDVLYICSEGGLYTVLPGRDAAERLAGVGWSVYGLGFSPNGDIYIGRKTEITFYTKLDRKVDTMEEEIADQVEKKISMHVKLFEEIDKKLSDFMSQMSSAVEALQKTVQILRGKCSVLKAGDETEAKLDILE